MRLRHLLLSLVAISTLSLAGQVFAAPVVVAEISGGNSNPTGVATSVGGGAGTFDAGASVSSFLNTVPAVVGGPFGTTFSTFNISNQSAVVGGFSFAVGNVTKTIDMGGGLSATFSLFNLVGTVNNATLSQFGIKGNELVTFNSNSANFDLQNFGQNSQFNFTFQKSGANFGTFFQSAGTLGAITSSFDQLAMGPRQGPTIPEPTSLAIWGTMMAAGWFVRRRMNVS
jgi:hypothetical protein